MATTPRDSDHQQETANLGIFRPPLLYGASIAIGLAFRHLPGWWAYGAGAVILISAILTPYLFFINHRVFPFATSFFVAWLGTLTAASRSFGFRT